MRMPTLRYGDIDELVFYADGRSAKDLARILRRSERSVHDWLTGKQRCPWWVPELLRLRAMEARERHRQMGFTPMRSRLGIVVGDAIKFTAVKPTNKENKNEIEIRSSSHLGPDPDGVRIDQAS